MWKKEKAGSLFEYEVVLQAAEKKRPPKWALRFFKDEETGEFYMPMWPVQTQAFLLARCDGVKIVRGKAGENSYFPLEWIKETYKEYADMYARTIARIEA